MTGLATKISTTSGIGLCIIGAVNIRLDVLERNHALLLRSENNAGPKTSIVDCATSTKTLLGGAEIVVGGLVITFSRIFKKQEDEAHRINARTSQ
jgi:hypothetical protein